MVFRSVLWYLCGVGQPADTEQRNLTLLTRRLNAGLSMRQAAEEIGVSLTVYKNAERGVTPRPNNAVKFADYYGVPVTELFYPELGVAA